MQGAGEGRRSHTRPSEQKYCEEHGREIDDLLESGDAGKIMQWWVKSYRNPAQATEETK